MDTPQKKAPPMPDYSQLLLVVKERVRSAQYAALKAVNTELVGLYWDIGQMIVERQANTEHGAAIAEQLAEDLRREFPGVSGFSRRNVFYMREFYLLYQDDERVQPLVAQIGWTHNLVILQRCKGMFSEAQSGAQSGAQSDIQILQALSTEALSAAELVKALLLQTKTGALKRALKELLAEGLIAYTIPDKPNSRLQKYQLTPKSHQLLQKGDMP